MNCSPRPVAGSIQLFGIHACWKERTRSATVSIAFRRSAGVSSYARFRVARGTSSDSERPLTLGGAESVAWEPMQSFDYVALGHLHGPQIRGGEHIRYSGSLLKYSFSEATQRKGVTLVEVGSEGVTQIAHHPLLPRRDVRVLEGELAHCWPKGPLTPTPMTICWCASPTATPFSTP